MALIDLLLSYLLDPFRIGLLIALALTTASTAAHTGRVVPLALGLVFVAVLIATTTGAAETGLSRAIGVGILANAIILGVILAAQAIWFRLSRRNPPD